MIAFAPDELYQNVSNVRTEIWKNGVRPPLTACHPLVDQVRLICNIPAIGVRSWEKLCNSVGLIYNTRTNYKARHPDRVHQSPTRVEFFAARCPPGSAVNPTKTESQQSINTMNAFRSLYSWPNTIALHDKCCSLHEVLLNCPTCVYRSDDLLLLAAGSEPAAGLPHRNQVCRHL